jgi:hypothetical protein
LIRVNPASSFGDFAMPASIRKIINARNKRARINSINDGELVKSDFFRYNMPYVAKHVHENGISIKIGEEYPIMIVEDADLADPLLVDEAIPFAIRDARANWSDLQLLMTVNGESIVLYRTDPFQNLVLVRLHDQYDRSRMENLLKRTARHRKDARWKRLEEKMVEHREIFSRINSCLSDLKTLSHDCRSGQEALSKSIMHAHQELRAKLDILIENNIEKTIY